MNNRIFAQFVRTYTTPKNKMRYSAQVPDGKGGSLRKRGFVTKEHACLWSKGAYERGQMGVYHTRLTFIEFCIETLVNERLARPKTKERYGGVVRNYFEPFFKRRKLIEIDLRLVHSFRTSLEMNNSISPTYRRMIFHIFKQAYKEAAERGFVSDTRVLAVKPPKQNPSPSNTWNESELSCFLSHEDVMKHDLYPVWKFAVFSGLRAGELAGLRWIDVNLNEGKIHVRRTKCQSTGEIFEGTKNKETRMIPLLTEAKEVLLELKKNETHENGEVFHGLDLKHLSRDLKKACKDANVLEIRMHDLRHTFATRLTSLGANSRLISMLLGHRDLRSTERYVHKNSDVLQSLWSIFMNSKN